MLAALGVASLELHTNNPEKVKGLREAGVVVARLDADDLRAQLRAAESQVVQARRAVEESQAGVRKSRTDVSLAGKTAHPFRCPGRRSRSGSAG